MANLWSQNLHLSAIYQNEKKLWLVILICQIWEFLSQNVANFSIFGKKIFIFLWQNLGFQMVIFHDARLLFNGWMLIANSTIFLIKLNR